MFIGIFGKNKIDGVLKLFPFFLQNLQSPFRNYYVCSFWHKLACFIR